MPTKRLQVPPEHSTLAKATDRPSGDRLGAEFCWSLGPIFVEGTPERRGITETGPTQVGQTLDPTARRSAERSTEKDVPSTEETNLGLPPGRRR